MWDDPWSELRRRVAPDEASIKFASLSKFWNLGHVTHTRHALLCVFSHKSNVLRISYHNCLQITVCKRKQIIAQIWKAIKETLSNVVSSKRGRKLGGGRKTPLSSHRARVQTCLSWWGIQPWLLCTLKSNVTFFAKKTQGFSYAIWYESYDITLSFQLLYVVWIFSYIRKNPCYFWKLLLLAYKVWT